jgi:hypothetical protein
MYNIVRWHENLDLSKFYEEARIRGFENNSSQKSMIDCFRDERERSVWILYYNNEPVGSVAAHSFDDVMGENSYRIAARTCVFTDRLPLNSLRTKNQIITHQHITSQFLIPVCINWAPKGSNLYITSNESSVGAQRLVHKIFCPSMEQSGQMARIKDVFYRGTIQTVWQLFPEEFYKNLEIHGRWKNEL